MLQGHLPACGCLTAAILALGSYQPFFNASSQELMRPSLNPEGRQASDIVLLNRWSVRNYQVQRGDVVSLISPKDPQQKIIKRVIALEGDIVKTRGYKNRHVKIPGGHFWIEGDHYGHSFDSNNFGPVSLGLLHARATHIIWPPQRWQKIYPTLPKGHRLLPSANDSSMDEDNE
ncbi:mitochondrial inner membrane protease subunit 2 [Polypterus senegalus]|uniref:mitochondrial inner membrane protease subunit 2 n=1 Tax=Polypterus senegalus TaxID=55291 RepID=UPI0019640468|nr:mitochondrial inner membrane protease subunit 2 [Polypterus senegalus]